MLGRMSGPAVSVLMAVRDVERWLPTTLDSLRSQTRKDFEIVAVDDGSSDGTSEILRSATDLPITIIRAEGVGIGGARNLAMEVASAPLFSVLDGDDMWLPCYVERVVGRLEADPDVAIVSPEVVLAVEEEITSRRYYADGYPLRWFEEDQLEHLAEMNYFVPLSTYRREVVDTVGGYDATPDAIEDWDLWVRALQAGYRAGHVTEPCGVYRLRKGSTTSNRLKLIRGRIAILERLAATEGPVARKAQLSLRFQQFQLLVGEGKEALQIGDRRKARASFVAAARHPDAQWRQRGGALAAAAFPRIGQAVLTRRATSPSAHRVSKDTLQARE
jgi:glycosyltransferase involved in cell wall biosynthesis